MGEPSIAGEPDIMGAPLPPLDAAWTLSGRAARVYALLASRPGTTMSSADISTELGMSQRTVFRAFKDLKKARQLCEILRFDGPHRTMLAPRRWVSSLEEQPRPARCHSPMTPLAELKYFWEFSPSLDRDDHEAAAESAHTRVVMQPEDAAASSPFEPLESAAPEFDERPAPLQALTATRPPEARPQPATAAASTLKPRADAAQSSPALSWPDEARTALLDDDQTRPMPRPSHRAAATLAPDVLARLQRLPGWHGAATCIARARITPDEQRRVLDKLEAVRDLEHAGKCCHGPIQDVLNERDRAAETAELIAPLPDLDGVGPEYVRELLTDLQAEHDGVRDSNPAKARALHAQIGQVRAHLGLRDVSPPKQKAPLTHEEAQALDRRAGRASQPPTPEALALREKLLKESPHG